MQDQQDIEALQARVDELEARNRELRDLAEAEPAAKRGRGRSILAAVLIVVSVLLAPLATVGTWARLQLVDTDRFVATFAPLADDPAVQSYISDQVVDAVEENIDIDTLVGDLFEGLEGLDLPPRAAAALPLLEAPAASGVRSLIDSGVDRVVASDQFSSLWEGALRETHSVAISVIQGNPDAALQLDDSGTLSLSLGNMIADVKDALVDRGVGFAERIPEIDRAIPIVASDSFVLVRTVYQVAVMGGYWLPWVAVGALVLGVAVARNRARAAAWGGFGLALSFLLLSLGIGVGRVYFVGSVSPSLMPGDAAEAVFAQLTEAMHSTIIALLVLSLFIAIGGWLAGRSRSAAAVRAAGDGALSAARGAADRYGLGTGRFGGGVERWSPTIRIATILIGVLVLFLNRPVTMGGVITTVVIVLLVLLVIELLRRPEAPEAADAHAEPEASEAPEEVDSPSA